MGASVMEEGECNRGMQPLYAWQWKRENALHRCVACTDAWHMRASVTARGGDVHLIRAHGCECDMQEEGCTRGMHPGCALKAMRSSLAGYQLLRFILPWFNPTLSSIPRLCLGPSQATSSPWFNPILSCIPRLFLGPFLTLLKPLHRPQPSTPCILVHLTLSPPRSQSSTP